MLRFTWLLVAALAIHTGATSAQSTVRLMAATSPPYAEPKLRDQGISLQIVEHVFAGTDYQAEIAIERWSRALEGASLGVYNGLASAWYSDERNETMEFSEPYLSSKLILLKRRGDPRTFKTPRDIAGTRLGILNDYAYGMDFESVRGLRLHRENFLVQNLLKLADGSIDLVLGDRRSVLYHLDEYLSKRRTEFEVVDVGLPTVQRHVALSREYPQRAEVLKAFNASLAKAKEDGSLAAIVSQWDKELGVSN